MKSIPFTAAYSKPALSISTVCKISEPYDASFDSGMHPPYHELNAIWDTGAMRSTISTKIARKLNLIPLGQTRVCHADGESFCNYYVVNLLLPNRMEKILKLLFPMENLQLLLPTAVIPSPFTRMVALPMFTLFTYSTE